MEDWRAEVKYYFLLLIYDYQKHFYTLNIFRKLQRDIFFYYVAFEIVDAMNISSDNSIQYALHFPANYISLQLHIFWENGIQQVKSTLKCIPLV